MKNYFTSFGLTTANGLDLPAHTVNYSIDSTRKYEPEPVCTSRHYRNGTFSLNTLSQNGPFCACTAANNEQIIASQKRNRRRRSHVRGTY